LRIVENLRRSGIKVGGIVSSEILENGVRVGFKIIDLEGGAEGILAHIRQRSGPQVGKYRVCLRDLENIGVGAILNACKSVDLIIIDEVGPMELYSEAFKDAVLRALESDKIVLGTIHYRVKTSFTNMIRGRGDVEIIEVTYDNRNSLPRKISELILKEIKKKSGG